MQLGLHSRWRNPGWSSMWKLWLRERSVVPRHTGMQMSNTSSAQPVSDAVHVSELEACAQSLTNIREGPHQTVHAASSYGIAECQYFVTIVPVFIDDELLYDFTGSGSLDEQPIRWGGLPTVGPPTVHKD